MPERAVSDTGPVLHLGEVGELGQLEVFESVAVSQQVRSELRKHGALRHAAEILGDRLRVERVTQEQVETQRRQLSSLQLHAADLSTCALAARVRPDVVLTDDLALRKGLEGQGQVAVGSVGVLVRAYRTGRLSRTQLDASLDRLFNGSSLYTSQAFRARVRELLDKMGS